MKCPICKEKMKVACYDKEYYTCKAETHNVLKLKRETPEKVFSSICLDSYRLANRGSSMIVLTLIKEVFDNSAEDSVKDSWVEFERFLDTLIYQWKNEIQEEFETVEEEGVE